MYEMGARRRHRLAKRAFDRPYENGIQAPTYFTDEFIDSKISDLVSRGFAVSAHAIGRNRHSSAYKRFRKADCQLERTSDDAMPNCMRYRIDHCEFPAPDTLERIYELKPSVTIQPGYSWMVSVSCAATSECSTKT